MSNPNVQTAHHRHTTTRLPHTPRGRALYTVDLFTNGTARLRDHDNPRLSLPGSHVR